jgi:hypothetical protein
MKHEILSIIEAKNFLKIYKGKFDYLVRSKQIYSRNIRGNLYFLKSDLLKYSQGKAKEIFEIFESSINK